MSNVNDTYFEGHYKNIWRSVIPAELSLKEVDFMVQYFNLQQGNAVLDLMCGYGRHAILLARKGIQVTAIDNLAEYIEEINRTAVKENLPVKAISTDVMKYTIDNKYDLAICMGNSLNFLDRENARQLLTNTGAHLKPGGQLLINTWSLAEIVIKNFTARAWNETDGVKHIDENRYLFFPTRIETDSTFLFPDGRIEARKAIDYIFSVAEMETLLADSGFTLKEIYSIPGKRKFSLGDPRAYIVAGKA